MSFKHGTVRGYNVFKCRCADCKKASADARRARYVPVVRAPRAKKVNPEDIPHGHYRYSKYKCRCAVCTEDHREKVKSYRNRAKVGKLETRGSKRTKAPSPPKVSPRLRSKVTQTQLDRALYHLQDGCSYTEAGRTVGMSASTLKSYFPGYEGQGRLNMVEINSKPELKALHDEIWNMELPQ